MLEATIAELASRPYPDVTVDSIASAAGVHKTTIYRRWGGKEELVRQALAASAGEELQVPDLGNVEADLRALGRAVQAVLSSHRGAAVVRSVLAAASSSEEMRVAVRAFWADRRAVVRSIADRGVARGELPQGTDPSRLMEALAAPLFYRLLVLGGDVTERDADVSADAALAAARAGVFIRDGPVANPAS